MKSNRFLFQYENHFQKISHVRSNLILGEDSGKNLFVSIIIPTYKRYELLKDAIESAINQNEFVDYEILIVDNEPELNNGSHRLVESYQNKRIRYYKHDENIGMFGNWNRAIELANGKWITLLHDDDFFLPGILDRIYNIIQGNSQIAGIKAAQTLYVQPNGGNIIEFAKMVLNKTQKRGVWKLRKTDNLYRNSLQTPCGIFMLKEYVIQLGGFNPDHYPAADYLFTTNYLFHYNMYHTNEIWWICRVFNNESQNSSTRQKIMEQNYFIRKAYGDLLNFPVWLIKPFVLFLSYDNIKYLNSLKLNIDNSFLKRLNKIKLKNKWLSFLILKLLYIEQRIRKELAT
jgi:glycosyltransferase involved in cell wall biosynthesis